jgi:hypothetical protein
VNRLFLTEIDRAGLMPKIANTIGKLTAAAGLFLCATPAPAQQPPTFDLRTFSPPADDMTVSRNCLAASLCLPKEQLPREFSPLNPPIDKSYFFQPSQLDDLVAKRPFMKGGTWQYTGSGAKFILTLPQSPR